MMIAISIGIVVVIVTVLVGVRAPAFAIVALILILILISMRIVVVGPGKVAPRTLGAPLVGLLVGLPVGLLEGFEKHRSSLPQATALLLLFFFLLLCLFISRLLLFTVLAMLPALLPALLRLVSSRRQAAALAHEESFGRSVVAQFLQQRSEVPGLRLLPSSGLLPQLLDHPLQQRPLLAQPPTELCDR